MVKKLQTIRGMKDILPEDIKYFQFIFKEAEDLLKIAGFSKISTPILEYTELFERTVGQSTDIVEKEMYIFQDKGGESISLRPEMTAPICRAYIQHGMDNWPKPVKLYYIEPNFRYERPQKGRQRQFWQVGFEVLGTADPISDAEVISLTIQLLRKWQIKNFSLQINSIGCPRCRAKYKKPLISYYDKNFEVICDDCKRRILKNPLRVLDCKNKKCFKIKEKAPQILDYLCDECSLHFKGVLEYLDELEILYELNPYLVRGLDYYTKTAFEILPKGEEDSDISFGGGGRYDNLIETLGGSSVPGCGVAFGVERIIDFLLENKIKIKEEKKPSVFVVQLGEKAKRKALILVKMLREAEIASSCALSKESLKSQLKIANKMGTPLVLILGEQEVLEDTIILRDMNSGIQEVIQFSEIVFEVKKRLPRPL